MIERYRHRYTVTASDMTAQYTLTPNAMLMYAQDCFARMMTLCRVAAFDVVGQRRMWVITEYTADIQPVPVFWSEDIVVELWVSELTSLRIYTDFRILRADDGRVVASGTFQMNILNTESHRLEPTDFLLGRFAVVPELTTPSHKKQRFPKGATPLVQMEHRVSRLDVDFNGHMGNRSYVDIALLTVPDDRLCSRRLAQMTVHWLRESHLGDRLLCQTCRIDGEPDCLLHSIADDAGAAVCEMLSRWVPDAGTPDIAQALVREQTML